MTTFFVCHRSGNRRAIYRARSHSEVSLRANGVALHGHIPSLAVAPSLVLRGTSETVVLERIPRLSELRSFISNPNHSSLFFSGVLRNHRPGAEVAAIMLWYWARMSCFSHRMAHVAFGDSPADSVIFARTARLWTCSAELSRKMVSRYMPTRT